MSRPSLRLALLASVLPSVALAAPVGSDIVQLNEVVVDRAKSQDPSTQPREITVLPGTEPVRDYVPRDSYTATKTGAKLIETPQAVSVVGAQQIRDLNAQNIGQAVEYVSGVLPSTFGFDPRNDFFQVRGFPAQQTGYFLDGLQLYSESFGAFRVEPFGLERIEVLKGPASVLYGGSNVGGIINAVSKVPTGEGVRLSRDRHQQLRQRLRRLRFRRSGQQFQGQHALLPGSMVWLAERRHAAQLRRRQPQIHRAELLLAARSGHHADRARLVPERHHEELRTSCPTSAR